MKSLEDKYIDLLLKKCLDFKSSKSFSVIGSNNNTVLKETAWYAEYRR